MWDYYLHEAVREIELAKTCLEFKDTDGYNRHLVSAWQKFRIGTMAENSIDELIELIDIERKRIQKRLEGE